MIKNKIQYVITICLSFLVTGTKLSAANLAFEHLTIKDGLSQSGVVSIFRDSKGFMWFGTEDGLNKYDGYTIVSYLNRPSEKNSLSNNRINALVEDDQGNLWIGTGNGLNRLNLRTGKIDRYYYHAHPADQPSNITSLVKDSSGRIWAGTSKGPKRYDPQTNSLIDYLYDNHKKPFVSVQKIDTFKGDSIIAIIGRKIFQYDPQEDHFCSIVHQYPFMKNLADKKFFRFCFWCLFIQFSTRNAKNCMVRYFFTTF